MVKDFKSLNRRGAEAQSLYLLTAPQALLTTKKVFSVSPRLDNSSCVVLLTGVLP